jgi:N-acetyl-gamma-glutamyl-phosphate reductase
MRIAIVGATGYTGAEVISILAGHPSARVVGLFSSGRSEPVASIASVFPRLRGVCELPVASYSDAALEALDVDAVFLATPVEVSHEVAPRLAARGVVVLDLSAAFRLSGAEVFEKYYGFRHGHMDAQRASAYGLPEWNRAAIASANLIACPGCYATAAILPIRALVHGGVIDGRSQVIVDGVSGVSGAGRTPSAKTHFCEVSLQAYGVLRHRHAPEMAEHAGVVGGVRFVPHIAPWDRGILATIHAELAPGMAAADARRALESAYAEAPFVRVLPAGEWPSVGAVERTNFCDIGLETEGSHVVVCAAIDNLLKGASGQAVQCMNIRFGLPETAGLLAESAREGVGA